MPSVQPNAILLCLSIIGPMPSPAARALDVGGPSEPAAAARVTPGTATDIARTLDDFHDAASKGDEARYFAHFAPEGIFLGTDATERWDVAAFRAYAHPYFSKGKGWTFVPHDRHVTILPEKTVAFFDEKLQSASYGECRGTGVVRLIASEWRIVQYDLTIPIPNELAKELVGRIARSKGTPASPAH